MLAYLHVHAMISNMLGETAYTTPCNYVCVRTDVATYSSHDGFIQIVSQTCGHTCGPCAAGIQSNL